MKSETHLIPSIQNYQCFRTFLKDLYQYEKKYNKEVSLDKFVSKLNMSSSALRHIISGSRNLTIESLHNIASVFLFSYNEREYFEALTLWNQSKSAEEKAYYSERMGQIKQTYNEKVLHLPATKVLSQWYIPSVLVYIKDHASWNDDRTKFILEKEKLDRLSKKLSLDMMTLKKSIEKLRDFPNLFNEEGKSIQIILDKKSSDNAQKQYLISVNQNGISRIQRNFHRKDCYFVACSANLTKESFSSLKEKLRTLIDSEVTSVDPNAKNLTLHQMNFNIYPID